MKKFLTVIWTIILIFNLSGCKKDTNKEPINNESHQRSEITVSERFPFKNEVSPLTPIYEGKATNYGHNNYSGDNYQNYLSNMSYKLSQVMNMENTGYSIIPDTGLYIWQNEDKQNFAYSGIEQITPVDMFGLRGRDLNNARNNRTGYLMGIFESEYEAIQAREEYLLGEKFMNGELYPENPTIVMNGRIIENMTYFTERSHYWLPITEIFDLRGLQWYENGNGIGLRYMDVNRIFPASEILGVSPLKNQDTDITEFYVDEMIWCDNFKLIRRINDKWYAEASLIARYVGMEIKVSENLVVITTDTYDIPQEFYILNSEDNTYTPFDIGG